jgi:predicted RNase H-like HicB family nuclease
VWRRHPLSKIEASADIIHKVVKIEGETYRVRLEPDLDVGGYVVHSETPPQCSSQGETVEEALEMIADAITLIVSTHKEKGWPLAAE